MAVQAELLGVNEGTNVQGEEQKKLDTLSSDFFTNALVSS